MSLSQMLDARPLRITDLGHRNRDETDVIMTKIRDMKKRSAGPGAVAGRRPPVVVGLAQRQLLWDRREG